MIACPAFAPAAPYLPTVAAYADCRALALGAQGWQALAADSGFGMALSGLVAIAIALLGYRLLLGETLTLRDATLTALRIGIVLALATNWSTWRPLVYDLATQAPEHIATTLTGGPGTLPLITRLQTVIDALTALRAQPGMPGAANAIGGDVPIGANLALGHAAQILTFATLGGLLAVRLLAGVLLAVGPLFAATLLFPATWGLFVGWLRALAGAALGALALPLVLGIELAIIAPQVTTVTSDLATNTGAGPLPDEILSTALVFALVIAVVLAGMARVACGFTLAPPHRHPPAERHPAPIPASAQTHTTTHHATSTAASRTETIATTLLRLEARDRLATLTATARAQPTPPTGAPPRRTAPSLTTRTARLRDNRP